MTRALIMARHLVTAQGQDPRAASEAATADLVDDYRFVDTWRMPADLARQPHRRLAHLLATRRQAHAGLGHGDARHRDGANELEGIERLGAVQRRAFHLHQMVDRHRFRIRVQVGQLGDQASALQA